MKCPACAVELEVKLAGPIEVDECPLCGGTWFEDDELRRTKDAWDDDLNWMDFEIWKEMDSLDLISKDLPCPSCAKGLVGVQYADTGVQVDCCPSCKGIWLDDGEFGAIIDALTAELLTKPFSKYIKATLQEAKEALAGPESISSEWRDFKTVLRLLQYRLLAENPRVSSALSEFQAKTGA